MFTRVILSVSLLLSHATRRVDTFARQPAPPAAPRAQQQPPPLTESEPPAKEDEVVRITSNLVQFDAVVTDGDGRPVTDLRPEEFRVLVEGEPQEVTNFSFVAAGAKEPAPAARPDKSAAPPPPVPVRPAQVRRTIALLVDDLGTAATDLYGVRRALRKFVDEQMQPGDLVAIVQTGKGLGALQQFTTDKRLLHRAIDRVRWNPLGRAGLTTFAPAGNDLLGHVGASDVGTELDDVREGVFTVGTLGALDFVVRGMKELPGRKSVVLFSGGFAVYKDPANLNLMGTDRVAERLRRLTEQANRASVVIYTIDARGVIDTGQTAADGSSSPEKALAVMSSRFAQVVRNQEGLAYLAEQTGGFLVKNSNDISGGVRRALEDQKGYYLIGFRPPADLFERAGGRTRFNKFEVRVTRPGARVRTRAGFYGYAEGQTRPAPRTRSEQMLAALTSPLSSGGLSLRLTSVFSSTVEGVAVVDSLVHVDASQLSLADESGGWKRAVFDVLALTFGENGQVVDEINRRETVRVRGGELRKMLADGFVYTIRVPVMKPGAYQLRVAMRDTATERLGSASQFIEVPDLKKGRLTLSGIFLMAAESPPAQGRGGPDPLLDAAVRRFRQGTFMDFRYNIYNAKAEGPGRRPRLLTQTRLFRDGRAVYESPPQPLDPGAQPGAAGLEAGRRILLHGAQLPPGDYVLQVVVTDELARGKHRTATQWIDFEVVN